MIIDGGEVASETTVVIEADGGVAVAHASGGDLNAAIAVDAE